MINKVKVVNSYGEELTMTLREPQFSGYAITDISGIGPTDVDIKQTQFVSGRKYKYNAGFHKYREISISIIYYEWNELMMGVEQLRNSLYKYFKTNDKVILYFEKDDIQYAIEGYVSKHEPTYFSNNCGARIVVLCPDPWFRKYDTNYLDEVQITNDEDGVNIIYTGDISIGFKMTLYNLNRYSGKTATIITIHEISGITREFTVNIPSTATEGYLIIDLLSDNINVYHNDKNCNGWIDATTIEKRQELPEIFNGVNLINIKEEKNLGHSFKIEYNTLYRGL